MIYYYLLAYPMESLVASELNPQEFGSYVMVSTKRQTANQFIFFSVKPNCSKVFDWEYAKKNCVPHPDKSPKISVYLSIYRVLEHIPLSALNTCYLVTKDGLTLALEKSRYKKEDVTNSYYLYQEICPVYPLAISTESAKAFAGLITNGIKRIKLPAIIFADMRGIDFNKMEHTGNVGSFYDNNIEHLKLCLKEVQSKDKKIKIVDRAYMNSFAYQVIGKGLYAATKDEIVYYPMLSIENIKRNHYDWGKSAQIY